MRRSAFLCALLLASFASARASNLGPTRASKLVTIGANNTGPVCGLGTRFDVQALPDGTNTTFSIPAGQVFVLTSGSMAVQGATPLRNLSMSLLIDGTNVPFAFSVATDSAGTGTATFTLPTGFAVKSGKNICVAGGGSSFFATVQGYFATDH